jgi:TolB protein
MKQIRLVAATLMLLTACAQGAGGRVQPDGSEDRSPERPGNGAIAFIRSVPDPSSSDGVVPTASLVLLPVGGEPRVLDEVATAPPAWSPDGSTLAYLGRGGIWLLSRGEEPRRLTRCLPATCSGDGAPGWSPDGRSVVFPSDREGGAGLWTVSTAGGEPEPLVRGVTVRGSPSWSPDGSTIAVIATVDGSVEKIVGLVDAASGELRNTLEPEAIQLGDTVAWSPDGELLLVVGIASDDGEGVYTMRADGSELRSLTSCSGADCVDVFPVWSPDGTRVLFTRGRCDAPGGDCYSGDLFAIETDGGRLERLTGGPPLDCCAAWQPVPAG